MGPSSDLINWRSASLSSCGCCSISLSKFALIGFLITMSAGSWNSLTVLTSPCLKCTCVTLFEVRSSWYKKSSLAKYQLASILSKSTSKAVTSLSLSTLRWNFPAAVFCMTATKLRRLWSSFIMKHLATYFACS